MEALQNLSGTSNLTGLSATMQGQFYDWVEARKPQEDEFLRCYQDNMRIWRDDDTKDGGTSKAQKSKVFVGSTRSKVRSARAKIKDSLFGAGQMPFDTEPTNENLKQFSDVVEEILNVQLEQMEFPSVLGTGVDTLGVYGTGFMFGPFVKEKTHTTVEEDQSVTGKLMSMIGRPRLKEKKYIYSCPYFEHGATMDCYPDPEAQTMGDARGLFWATRVSPHFLKSLKGAKGYNDGAIDAAMKQKVPGSTGEGSDRTQDARMNLYRYTKDGRIWFVRYFGLVSKRQLAEWRAEDVSESPETDLDDMVEAMIQMAGGYVIKADPNPYKHERRPSYRSVYEDTPHEIYGVGIAKNNEANQKLINAGFRLYIEGKAMALLKMCSVDRSKFEASEDFKFFPGKRFAMRPGLTSEERKEAIIWHDMVDVTEGWERLIEMAERFSDDDTAITKYSQGNDSQDLNKTATGISMIMNASTLPLKEVLSNIDQMWIEPMIEALLDWNLDHLEPETVKVLLGEKQAQVWKQIQEYGKTNFMEWFATGSKTFMAKEVLMNKMNGFLQLVSSNPVLANLVDMRELLEQVWNAGQIGGESPVFDEETLKKNQAEGPMQHAQQAIEEIKKQAGEAIKQAEERAKAAEQQAVEAKRQETAKLAELRLKERKQDSDERNQLVTALAGMRDAGLKATELGANIDLKQAQIVKTNEEAGVESSDELETAAAEREPVEQ